MASFYIYDLTFLVLFTIFVIIFLYSRKKGLKREGIMYLYRTQIGVKIINYIGKKHAKFLHYMEYVVITFGYLLMAGGIWMIGQVVWIFVSSPDFVRAVKIPPIAPLVPYIGEIFNASWLPPFYFTYWIVALAVTAIFHEFMHGIFMKKNNIRIKSTGFAFLGPFLGAFVEQDEKQMTKAKTKSQLAILGAGSFANLILTVIFFILLVVFSWLAYSPSGAIVNNYAVSDINSSIITGVNNSITPIDFNGQMINMTLIYSGNNSYFIQSSSIGSLKNFSIVRVYDDAPAIRAGVLGIITEFGGNKISTQEDLSSAIATEKPGDSIEISVLENNKIKNVQVTLVSRPDNSSRAYLGVAGVPISSNGLFGKIRNAISSFRSSDTYYAPKAAPNFTIFVYNLIWWVLLINFSVALFNMLPVGIFDGGRFFFLTVQKFAGKKVAQRAFSFMTYLFIAVFALITVIWIVYTFL